MEKIDRETIGILSQHTNLTETEVAALLEANCYTNKVLWEKFIRLFLLALGVGFSVSGVVFFFAYNWDLLSKFVKLSIILLLLITSIAVILVPKTALLVKKISLTAAAVLVGVLFAVYGQIYQTGADSYDFFLAWTVFCTLFVIVGDFAPLWLLYLVLSNTTFGLYMEQTASDWPKFIILFVFLSFNFSAFILATYFTKKKPVVWFLYLLALATTGIATFGNAMVIYDGYDAYLPLFVGLTLLVYAFIIWQGWQTKTSFYLALIALSCIVLITTFMIEKMDNDRLFLALTIFIVLSVTATIKGLLTLQKKWSNEN